MIKVHLTELLAARGKTYYQLSKETGVDHSIYIRLAKGETQSITFRTLEGVCTALGCTPNDFLEVVANSNNKE